MRIWLIVPIHADDLLGILLPRGAFYPSPPKGGEAVSHLTRRTRRAYARLRRISRRNGRDGCGRPPAAGASWRHASRTPALEADMHMAMPNTLAGWRVPDLYRLPDDGNTYELVHGELFVTPAPSAPHQEVVSALTEVLFPYVAKHRIGRLHFPHSVVRVGTNSQVEPD